LWSSLVYTGAGAWISLVVLLSGCIPLLLNRRHTLTPMPESVTDRCTKAHEYIFLLSKSRSYHFDNEAIKTRAHPDSSNRDRDAEGKFNNTPGRTRMAGLKTNHYELANKRSVWSVNTRSYKEAHFATYPPELIEPCILSGCPVDGTVLDPFGGSGTTAEVALTHGRNAILCELNPEYIALMKRRLSLIQPNLI